MIFFFQAEDGIRDYKVTGVQTCALPILDTLAVATPGTCATAWRTASFALRRSCQVGFAPFGRARFIAKTWSGSKPNGVWGRATDSFIAPPAPAIHNRPRATLPRVRRRGL